jgi:hypothetical protein
MTQSSSRRGVTEACSHCVLLAEASPIPIAPGTQSYYIRIHMPCHASTCYAPAHVRINRSSMLTGQTANLTNATRNT